MKLTFEVEDGEEFTKDAPMAYLDRDGDLCICDANRDVICITSLGLILYRAFTDHQKGWDQNTCTDLTGKTLKITFGGEA